MEIKGIQKLNTVAIFFDIPSQECIDRVRQRTNHPTLPSDRAAKAVASFSKLMSSPQTSEGFSRVFTLKNTSDEEKIIKLLLEKTK